MMHDAINLNFVNMFMQLGEMPGLPQISICRKPIASFRFTKNSFHA